MNYIVIDVLTNAVSFAEVGAAVSFLSLRRGRWWITLWVTLYLTAISTFFKYGLHLETVFPVMIAACIVLGIIWGDGKLHIRAMLGVFLMLTSTVAELLSSILFSFAHPEMDMRQAQADLSIFITFKSIAIVFWAVVLLIFCFLWRATVQKRRDVNLTLYSIFPLSQLVLVGGMFVIFYRNYPIGHFIWLMAMAVALCVLTEICLFYAIRQLMNQQDVKQQLVIQEGYYAHLLDSIEKTNKMRHDMNNQLQTAYSLFAGGEEQEAGDLLNSMRDIIKKNTSFVFCSNHIVDAVLVEKSRAASAADISFRADVGLPEKLNIEGVDLCSLFANLLDNAIHACRELPQERQKVIELNAHIVSGVLSLTVVNSFSPSAKGKKRNSGLLPAHGLGLSIVNDIAKRYDGKVETGCSDTAFTAKAYLVLPE